MRATFRFRLAIITLAVLAAAWFWALPPILTPLLYLQSSNWTEADLVRHIWHFRLVQPEWVSSPPQYDYLRWAKSETLARLAMVCLGWLGGSTLVMRGRLHLRLRSQKEVRWEGSLPRAAVAALPGPGLLSGRSYGARNQVPGGEGKGPIVIGGLWHRFIDAGA